MQASEARSREMMALVVKEALKEQAAQANRRDKHPRAVTQKAT